MSESTALIAIETLPPEKIFTSDGANDLLENIKAYYRSIDRDISTVKGRDNIRSIAYEIARSKTLLDKMGKKLTDAERAKVDSINEERNRVWDELEKLQAEIRAPLTEFEAREEQRVKNHEHALMELSGLRLWSDSYYHPSSVEIKDRMDKIAPTFDRAWEEFKGRAEETREEVTKRLTDLYDMRMKQEQEAIELATLRAEEESRKQKERDDAIAAEAAEKGRKAAEDKAAEEARAREVEVERERQAAAARVEAERRQREDAEARAKDAEEKAERDRIIAAEKAEQDKLAAIEAERARVAVAQDIERKAAEAREADNKHKKKINNEILAALVSVVEEANIQILDSDKVKIIVTAIAQGKVPHVKISY